MNSTIIRVTEHIIDRSKNCRKNYLYRMQKTAEIGPRRTHLTCGNQAHAYAARGRDQNNLTQGTGANLGIITAYKDLLSAH